MSVTACNDIEIVEFLRPDKNEQNVFVTNLPKTLTESAKYEALYEVFSSFGLIYEVQVLESTAATYADTQNDASASCDLDDSEVKAAEGMCMHYAFIKYFSPASAANAIESLNRKWMIEGHLLRVQAAHSPNAPTNNSVPLYVSQCRTLANHYLGFNGWSSKIVKLESVSIPDAATLNLLSDLAEDHDDSTSFVPGEDQMCYMCTVRLVFPRHDVTCHGTGTATVKKAEGQGPAGSMMAAGYAKKASLQRATEDAFSRVALISLPSGKVAVEQIREDPPGCALTVQDVTAELVSVTCLPDQDSDEDGGEEDADDGSDILAHLASAQEASMPS